MNLPNLFIDRMKIQLKDEWEAFLDAYDKPVFKGIRINTLKISVEAFLKITPFDLKPIPWTKDGFYIKSEERPGKHPHYYAGLYYIQEPSAMLPANLLKPDKGDVVLDLCAAPGGKTMQMAAMMKNEGLLVANDISSNRLRALIRNAELMGVKNLVVINDYQDKIAAQFPKVFDKMLIDAPCSGEGMFKKHDDAVGAYEKYDIGVCNMMQKEILDEIVKSLNDEGELVYSTCTFNTDENENMIEYLMSGYDLSLVDLPLEHGFKPGINMPGVIRLYPHCLDGEGHFAAKLKNDGKREVRLKEQTPNKAPEALGDFMALYFNEPLTGTFKIIKERVFLLPKLALSHGRVKLVKEGWYLGDLKKNRFEPSLAFALGLKESDFKQTISFSSESIEIEKYLKCETIHCEGHKGYNLICVDGYPVGWGKWANNKLKNLYPAAWRRN